MLVTAILLASLNFSNNPYYYRAAGIGAILIGVVCTFLIAGQSARIASIIKSSTDGSAGGGDAELVFHFAPPMILLLGGLVVLTIAMI